MIRQVPGFYPYFFFIALLILFLFLKHTELHDMLRSGRIPEVIDRLSELNPRLLEDDPNRKLLIRLHCAAFAMMVREAWEESSRSECTDVEACTDEEERVLRFRELCRPAIEYGRKYLSSWSSYDHSIQDRVVVRSVLHCSIVE